MKKNQLHFMKKLQRTLNTVINNSKKEISESDAKEKIKNLERKVDDLQNQVKKILYTIGRWRNEIGCCHIAINTIGHTLRWTSNQDYIDT